MPRLRPRKRQKGQHTTKVARIRARPPSPSPPPSRSPSRSPSPPPSAQWLMSALSKAPKRKREGYLEEIDLVIPWRRWVKGGERGQQPISKHTGEPLRPEEGLEDIATEPFDIYGFAAELWEMIFTHMDDATILLFSYTCSWALEALSARKANSSDPEAFPIPLDHRVSTITRPACSRTLRKLIDPFMGPNYIYDHHVNFYRTREKYEHAQNNYLEEREYSLNAAIMEKERQERAVKDSWDALVARIDRRNVERQQRRDAVVEWLRQHRAYIGEEVGDSEDDDVSVVSSDEEPPKLADYKRNQAHYDRHYAALMR